MKRNRRHDDGQSESGGDRPGSLCDFNLYLGIQKGPFANAYPYTPLTEPILHGLADLRPKQLALMHGSSFVGDGGRALRELAVVMKEILGADGSKRG